MTVRYSMLSAMLLNELQKETGQLHKLSAEMAAQKASTQRRISELQASHDRDMWAMRAAFDQRLSTLERAILAGTAPVAVKF